jgi:hypothetical protein
MPRPVSNADGAIKISLIEWFDELWIVPEVCRDFLPGISCCEDEWDAAPRQYLGDRIDNEG